MADKFVPPGEHEADAFIHDALLKKFPGMEDKTTAFMELQRQQGDQNYSANPLTTMLAAVRDQYKPDMPFEDFVTKFRDKAMKAMAKHKVKPYSVDVGPISVVEPAGAKPLMAAGNILKTIVSPAWDGVVGAMRVAASPLADLPENQDPAQREAIRRGLMEPLSGTERRKGQVEVLQGLLGVVAAGAVGADVGAAAAGVSHATGVAGYLKNVVEGAAWGGAFGAAEGAGQEEAANEILNRAEGGAVAGAALVGALGLGGRAVGAGLRKLQGYKLDKLMSEIDRTRATMDAAAKEPQVNPLAELLPQSGLKDSPAETSRLALPSNTKRFSNITLPDGLRETLSPEKVAFLQRADGLLREKGIMLDYQSGTMLPIPKEGTGLPNVQIPAETTRRLQAEAPVNTLQSSGYAIHLPAGMEADANKEISYRLVYGDRVFAEKSAEYDLLPPEAKAKLDFWTYLDKTEGTPAAQFMRNMEKSARSRLAARAARRSGKLFDITAGAMEGAYDLPDAAVIGAAKLYRLSHLAPDVAAQVWRNEMLQVLGDTAGARSALVWRVPTESRKQLEKMIQNMAPEMHDVRNLMAKYEQGKAGMDWYTNAYGELERMYGTEDARLMAHLLAIYSTGTNVGVNVGFALRDFARLKTGQAPLGGRFPTLQKKMVAEMLQGKPYGNQKVQNFIHLLLGGTGHAVNDIQVARSIGWVRDKFSKNQYRFVDEVIRGLAKDAGVSPEQYQASLWATPRIAKAQEAEAAGSKKSMRYIGSFRPYSEAIKIENVKAGINNTLKVEQEQGGGGYTFDPKNMHAWSGKGYLTTLTGVVVNEQDLKVGSVMKFVDQVRPLLKQYKNSGVEFTVGLWRKGDGTVSIDFNMVTPDKDKALAVARRTDQFAVGDMTTGKYEGDVPTGKDPESSQRQVKLPEVKRILKEILGA
jgi:hypothetical protein